VPHDTRNRTAPEIRHLFRVGQLGLPGSVGFFSTRRGGRGDAFPSLPRRRNGPIEAGAQNLERWSRRNHRTSYGPGSITDLKTLDAVAKYLKAAGWNVTPPKCVTSPRIRRVIRIGRKEWRFLNTSTTTTMSTGFMRGEVNWLAIRPWLISPGASRERSCIGRYS